MIWAVADPVVSGQPLDCDVFIWEQVSTCPSRCYEGLLQMFLQGPAYPTGEWVTYGRLLCQAETWEEMRRLLRQQPIDGKRVCIAPANHGASPHEVRR